MRRACTPSPPITASRGALWISRAAARAERDRDGVAVGVDARPVVPIYAVGVAAVAVLLAYEQQLVSPTDLSRVNDGVPERQRRHRVCFFSSRADAVSLDGSRWR